MTGADLIVFLALVFLGAVLVGWLVSRKD